MVQQRICRGDAPTAAINRAVAESADAEETLDNLAELFIGNAVVAGLAAEPTYDLWLQAMFKNNIK